MRLAAALNSGDGAGITSGAADQATSSITEPAEPPGLPQRNLTQDLPLAQALVPAAGVGKGDTAPRSGTEAMGGKARGHDAARTGRAGMPDTGQVMERPGAVLVGMSGVPGAGATMPQSAGPLSTVPPEAGQAAAGEVDPPTGGVGGQARPIGPRGEAPGRPRAAPSEAAAEQGVPAVRAAGSQTHVLREPVPALDVSGKTAADAPGAAAIVPAGLSLGVGQSLGAGLLLPAGAVGGAAPGTAARGHAAGSDVMTAPASASVYPQIAPALVSLAGGPAGTQRLTLRLDPVELGHVQIRIDRVRDAPPEISITADRPETLLLLQRDQHQLHRALDQAGIPADGRQVIFLASVQPSDTTGTSSAGPSLSAGADPGGSGRGDAGQDGARSRAGLAGGENEAAGDTRDAGIVAAGPRWLRAGVDIVA